MEQAHKEKGVLPWWEERKWKEEWQSKFNVPKVDGSDTCTDTVTRIKSKIEKTEVVGSGKSRSTGWRFGVVVPCMVLVILLVGLGGLIVLV